MLIAIREALKAEKKKMIPVGAVLVSSKKEILAKGHNVSSSNWDPTSHAEIRVIRKSTLRLNSGYLSGTSLYVTIEPCFMCMGAIAHSKISNLFFGSCNSRYGSSGSVYDLLSDRRFNKKVRIINGVCFRECSFLIKRYFSKKRI